MSAARSPLMSVAEAQSRLLATTAPLDTETVSVADAAGRVLAADVTAALTQPPFAAAAMDGYAVRFADVAQLPARLRVAGEAPAGRPYGGTLATGEAVRIFTGAALPEGADTVVIQEDTDRDGEDVIVREAPKEGGNVRAAGVDFLVGNRLFRRGDVPDGLGVALMAAANRAQVTVYRKPRLAILATGDELVPPGSDIAPGQIVNSIAPGLAALARQWGADIVHIGHARDTEDAIRAELDAALGADAVLLIGGASVGDYDLVKPALAARGLETDFEKAALKPGKPVWTGRIGPARILGLPGNPVSAFVCSYLFLRPALYAMTGRDGAAAARLYPALLQSALPAGGPREAFLNAHSVITEAGTVAVTPSPRQDSSLLSPLGHANCLVNRPAGAPAAAIGARVFILPLNGEHPAHDSIE